MKLIGLLVDSYRLLIFVAVLIVIALDNARVIRRLGRFPRAGRRPRVSVLVPARNEADSIAACVRSLLAQDYPDFELLVLDDNSADETGKLLARLTSPRLRVLTGQTLPEGWNGKPWACHQLARAADGELLLFTDADTIHRPDSLRLAVDAIEATGADMMTALIRNEVRTLGEQITVPFMVWAIMSILPVRLAHTLRRSKAFAAASGKLLLFRRNAYATIGGHAAVRFEAAEDVALARAVKGANLRLRLVDAADCVSARMYDGFRTAASGFNKNFFAIFDYRLLPALFVWLWMLTITWHPLASVAALAATGRFDSRLWAAAATVILAALGWLVVALKARLPCRLAVYYPLIMTAASALGLASIVSTVLGRTVWKDRRLVKHRIRLV
uniref:Glycosyltransferase n=1 Tax=candidate division WOR-3 bacterium TaxID=2052148 RepID=A0A7C4CBX0_UNCW3